MAKVTIKDLLEAGCHFGHQTKRWNPKMKDYVYGAKNGISIIDLTKTMHQINDACNFLQHVVMNGGNVLFVGTKRQAQQLIKEAADDTDMYYIATRWLGGTLTNNQTIRRSIAKMHELGKLLDSESSNGLKKKELASINRRCSKLHRNLDGIASMKKLPDVMIIVDVSHDDIAVREAVKLNIPTVAIVDTNSDPSNIDYPIAANDDAVKSIKVIMDVLIDSIKIAVELNHKRIVEEKAAQEAAKAAAEKKAAEEKAEREKVAKAAKAIKAAEAKKAKAEKAKAHKAQAKQAKAQAKKAQTDAKQAEAKQAEAKPAAKKATAKQVEAKQVEAKPAAKQAEAKPTAKKAEAKQVEAKPAAKKAKTDAKQAKPAAKKTETKAEAKPAAKKTETKAAAKPAAKKTETKAEAKPAAKKTETKAEAKQAEAKQAAEEK